MGLFNIFGKNKKKTVLVIQCRLSSTRLPRKALLPLGGKCVIDWVLQSMKKVKADKYYLATDIDSSEELKPFADKWGYDFYAGSRDDVLNRFCNVIRESKADIVIRATADNPFLFYEAASSLTETYLKEIQTSKIDYMTFTGLPHGSGVEIFDAHSLLYAAELTDDPYDHEHVGPSLYNHKDKFTSIFLKSPLDFFYPELRTTIDTPSDYRRAQAIVRVLSGYTDKEHPVEEPYSCKSIVWACKDSSVANPVLLVPSTDKGHGTGHLHRCLDIAVGIGADIYIPKDKTLEQCDSLVSNAKKEGLQDYQIVDNLEHLEQYSLCVMDMFNTDPAFGKKIASRCPTVSMDEGSGNTDYIDYLLDIIPSIGIERKANIVEPLFIKKPQRVRSEQERTAVIHNALVVLGGEDPSSLGFPAAQELSRCSIYTTLIVSSQNRYEEYIKKLSEEESKYIKIILPVNNLREELYKYDLVVTHYGFTAFEAQSAGCAVILLGTTSLHESLAKKYKFACLAPSHINKENIEVLLKSDKLLFHPKAIERDKSLNEYILRLSQGKSILCPVCQKKNAEKDTLIARTADRTFRRCQNCGMLYMSWTVQSQQTEYNREYFYEDYEKQYGKTYEDDFASIKAQGVRRLSIIDMLSHHHKYHVTSTVFDIGCALGPFLDAASDAGWQVYGTDACQEAVDYVQSKLKYPAVKSFFPDFDNEKEFGIESFDAVTMWYVIEHFQNVDEVLKKISSITKKGGIFAFSTPSASGVSAKYNTQSFFDNSPSDHYTLWEIKKASSILKRYGFKILKIVPTGIHPERFPIVKEKNLKPSSFRYKMLAKISKSHKLGDTFEVYCRKVK